MADSFMIAFGSALSLHREGGRVFLIARGERQELTLQQAEVIGDDFHRTVKAARASLQDSGCPQPQPMGRLGGETYGDD